MKFRNMIPGKLQVASAAGIRLIWVRLMQGLCCLPITPWRIGLSEKLKGLDPELDELLTFLKTVS
jgi:hypothetical protein